MSVCLVCLKHIGGRLKMNKETFFLGKKKNSNKLIHTRKEKHIQIIIEWFVVDNSENPDLNFLENERIRKKNICKSLCMNVIQWHDDNDGGGGHRRTHQSPQKYIRCDYKGCGFFCRWTLKNFLLEFQRNLNLVSKIVIFPFLWPE